MREYPGFSFAISASASSASCATSPSAVQTRALTSAADHDRADLVEREDGRPVLPVALQDEEDLVALPDADRPEVVRHLVRDVAYLAEREAAFGEMVADVQERELFGIAVGYLVDHVEGEVEALGVLELHVLEMARSVLLALDELVDDERHLLVARPHRLKAEMRISALARHHHREERDAVRVGREHAVRRRRAVVDRVAFVKLLDVLADAYLHRALEDYVELLPCVGRRGDGLVQERRVVLVGDPVGSAEAVLEHRRLVADVHVRLVSRKRALPRARHFIAGEVGAMALQKRVDVDAKRNRALVEEVERRVELPGLDRLVVLDGDLRLLRHLLNRIPDDLAHLAYARGHLDQILFRFFAHVAIDSGLTCCRTSPYFGELIYYIIFHRIGVSMPRKSDRTNSRRRGQRVSPALPRQVCRADRAR